MRLATDRAVSGHKPLVNAAVIVDLSVSRIIASETVEVYPSSVPHDMSIVETTPVKESGESVHCQNVYGVTNASSEISLNGKIEKQKGSLSSVACLNPWQWSLHMHDTGCSRWHPIRHALMVPIESFSARDRFLFPNLSESFCPDHVPPSNTDSPAKKQKTSSQSPEVPNESGEEAFRNSSMDRPYHCTGYEIFHLWEPCTMCAMTLVHQRGERSINHHYTVFKVLLPDEALMYSTTQSQPNTPL